MTDQELLSAYVDVWWQAINDFLDLLEELPDEEWSTPTDLPGWDVKAVASHIAHLEGILAGDPEETADVGEPPHVTGLMGLYTEIGVVTRRDASPDAIINEIRDGRHRAAHRAARRPADRRAPPSPSRSSAASPWDWRTLLRNRPLDVWMHEQDVRRAVDRPGGMDSVAGPAHRGVPRREPRLRARQEGRRAEPARRAGARARGQRRRSRSRSTTPAAASD